MEAEVIYSAIISVDKNGVLGDITAIPYNNSEFWKKFEAIIAGEIILIGRTTFNLFGDVAIYGNYTVVLTTKKLDWTQNVYRAPTLDIGYNVSGYLAEHFGKQEVFVVGGETLFEEAFPKCNKLYLFIYDSELIDTKNKCLTINYDEWEIDYKLFLLNYSFEELTRKIDIY